MRPVIFDTGPLVAWFCPRDQHHGWARKTFTQISTGGFICEAVLAEVCHLVAKDGIARSKVLEFAQRGSLTSVSLSGELPVLHELLDRYADAPMDFADACVVRLAELHADATVCTTDGHFSFFRKSSRTFAVGPSSVALLRRVDSTPAYAKRLRRAGRLQRGSERWA